jgi:hypothetical protein
VNQDKGGNYGAFGLNYPVFEDAGEMVGTIPGVAGEHGVSADFVRHVIYRHKELIGPIRHMTDCHTMDLVRQDKERYGFKRLHKDIDVLTLKQMRIISNYIHSKKGIEFQLKLDEVNQAHWRLTMIGQAPASARQAGVPEALLRPGLVLHVLAKNLNRGTAGRDEAVAWRPEHGFSSVGGAQRRKLFAQTARGYR